MSFALYFAALLALDWLLNRGNVTLRRSLLMAGGYVLAALVYAGSIYLRQGASATSQFLTIFSLEQLLSVDNLLVISLIFGYFKIVKEKQHTALLYGIVGAIAFRAIAIYAGTALIERLTWLLYGFAGFLIWSGYQIMQGDEDGFDPAEKKLVQFIRKRFGSRSLFLAAIIAIEFSDIMFAVDSIPASFSISRDPGTILSANLLAVAGLRSLYHAVSQGLSMVAGLEKHIGLVLMMLGGFVFVDHFLMPVPSWFTMASVFTTLSIGVLLSLSWKDPA